MWAVKLVGFLAMLVLGVCAFAETTYGSPQNLQVALAPLGLSLETGLVERLYRWVQVLGALSAILGFVLTSWQLFFAPKPPTNTQIARKIGEWYGFTPNSGEKLLTKVQLQDRPAAVLIARFRALPFDDRAGHLAAILEWSDTRNEDKSARDIRVRLIAAPGGYGKTRLAIETLRKLSNKGWATGFLKREALDSAVARKSLEDYLKLGRPKGYCLVIDYAGVRPEQVSLLFKVLSDLAVGHGRPVRVLLLARRADWWAAAATEGDRVGLADLSPYTLNLNQMSSDDRNAFFDASVVAFRERFKRSGIQIANDTPSTPSNELETDLYNRPLTIAMAAFLALRGNNIADSKVSLFDALIAQERDNWKRAAPNTDDDAIKRTRPMNIERAAIQATLCGGATLDQMRTLRDADPDGRDRDGIERNVVLNALKALYPLPTADQDEALMIGPIEPDILGEAAIGRVAETPDGLALLRETLLGALDDNSAGDTVRTVLAVMIRASYHPEIRTRENATRIIQDWAVSIVEILDSDQAQRLHNAIPEETLAFREFAAVMMKIIVASTEMPTTEHDKSARARALNDLGNRLSDLGDREGAYDATQEAVAIRRDLAQSRPDTFRSDLAMSLNNLGNILSDLGDREGARDAAQEAVDIYRDLAASRPDAFRPNLALSLNNLGASLSDLGDHEGSRDAAQESVAIYRDLAASRPDAFQPALAGSLNNLCGELSALGEHKEARDAAQESVATYRDLAAFRPDAFLPNLANSLSNLGDMLIGVDDPGSAVRAYEEALDSLEPYMAKYESVYGGLYAVTKMDLATALKATGLSDSEIEARLERWT